MRGIDVYWTLVLCEGLRFEKAATREPDNASAQNNLAIALEQSGEFDKARAAYEKAMELKPNDLYIQKIYDLFREADDKHNRKARKAAEPKTP